MPRVVILGAGVAGLACAWRLRERASSLGVALEVNVFERSLRAGGLIRTERIDGFVIERGPESIITDKPAGIAAIEALGLTPRLVRTRPENRGAYVVAHGRLERIPEGFQLLAPANVASWLATPYVSLPGRIRALADLVLPGRPREDETLGSFVRRRLGDEVLDRLAQPLVGGIYGAHPDSLGLRATLPRFLEMERAQGSVIRGLRARSGEAAAQGARYGLFVNFQLGMQELTDALYERVSDCTRLGAAVARVGRIGGASGGFRLALGDGTSELADALVIATGGTTTATFASQLDEPLGDMLGSIRHGSGAIVTLAFEASAFPRALDAYGYVTPIIEGRRVTASTWLSRKWPGRAPDGYELVRFFFGRDGDDDVVDLPDAELVRLAAMDAVALMGGTRPAIFNRVDRWHRAMPRFGVGHGRLVDSIEARTSQLPGLALAGNTFRGVGIPDTLASADAAASRVLEHLVRR